MKKCALIEACNWHEETLVNWVWYLNELNFFVEIYTIKTSEELKGCFQTKLTNFCHKSIKELNVKSIEGFDLIVVNTLIHKGYRLDKSMSILPDISFVLQFDIPLFCIIHDPINWSDKFPVSEYKYTGLWEEYKVFLREDGRFTKNYDYIKGQRWEIAKNKLKLICKNDFDEFLMNDGGGHSVYNNKNKLVHIEDYASQKQALLNAKNIAFFSLVDFGKGYLTDIGFRNSFSIFPTYCGDFMDENSKIKSLIVPGMISFDRKKYPLLTQKNIPYEKISENYSFCFLGGSRGDKNIEFDYLTDMLKKHKIFDHFHFTGGISYAEFYQRFCNSTAVVPLIDEFMDSGAYLTKLSAAVNQAIAFGKILIWDEKIASVYNFDCGITYSNGNLGEALIKFQNLSVEDLEMEKRKIQKVKDNIIKKNISELSEAIARISQ